MSDDYEDSPVYTINYGMGDLVVCFRPIVCKGCEFCVGTYCRNYESCEQTKNYDNKIATLAVADGSKKLVTKCITCCHFFIIEVTEVEGYPQGGVSLLLVNWNYSYK